MTPMSLFLNSAPPRTIGMDTDTDTDRDTERDMDTVNEVLPISTLSNIVEPFPSVNKITAKKTRLSKTFFAEIVIPQRHFCRSVTREKFLAENAHTAKLFSRHWQAPTNF
jgi:hypothetical protein